MMITTAGLSARDLQQAGARGSRKPPPQPESRAAPLPTSTEDEALSEEDPPGANAETPRKRLANRRPASILTLRIEYAPEVAGDLPIKDGDILPNWSREFTVSGRNTLEQLSETILGILGWDRDHLYEFRIADRVHVHMVFLGEDDLFVDSKNPCVSCEVPIRRLGLSVADVFAYIFDFGDCHTFRITVLDIQAASNARSVPALLSYRGKNIIQYRGTIRKAEARAFEDRPPTVEAPEPSYAPWRIRFIRGPDREILEEWRASNDKKLWQKAVTILENRNLSLENIAAKIERPEGGVRKWIKAFNRRGLDGLRRPDSKRDSSKTIRRGKPQITRDQRARRILEIVHAKPNAYGINRSNWSLPSIARAFEQEHKETISTGTVGRLLRQFGYAIRKARRVLTSPDPEYREKVEQVLNTLQNLRPDELFFFIDELGPLRVKKYGGRTLAAKNDVPTFPQLQAHKGSITMAGALSATANQVTWLFSPAKDTQSMIDLIELLFNQYSAVARIFLTWDAASWHSSISLVEWLDVFNAQTLESGLGPIIQLVPLPTSSQFLDVLEAVFSGMKRAVVHHSDYQSVAELKIAVSSHFVERNAFFKENPKRAGKKIWNVDFFQDTNNLRSGDYREW